MLNSYELQNWCETQGFTISQRYAGELVISLKDFFVRLIVTSRAINILFPRLILKPEVKDLYKDTIGSFLGISNSSYKLDSFYKSGHSSIILKLDKDIQFEQLQELVLAIIEVESLCPTISTLKIIDVLENNLPGNTTFHLEDRNKLNFEVPKSLNVLVLSHPDHYVSKEIKESYFRIHRVSSLLSNETKLLGCIA